MPNLFRRLSISLKMLQHSCRFRKVRNTETNFWMQQQWENGERMCQFSRCLCRVGRKIPFPLRNSLLQQQTTEAKNQAPTVQEIPWCAKTFISSKIIVAAANRISHEGSESTRNFSNCQSIWFWGWVDNISQKGEEFRRRKLLFKRKRFRPGRGNGEYLPRRRSGWVSLLQIHCALSICHTHHSERSDRQSGQRGEYKGRKGGWRNRHEYEFKRAKRCCPGWKNESNDFAANGFPNAA